MKSIEDIIVAHLNDEASTEEVKRLFEWIREEPENAKEFARCSLLHAQLRGQFAGELRARESGETSVGRTSTSMQARESRRTPKSVVVALAACLLIAVGACVWWMSAGGEAGEDLIVLAPIEQGNANEPMLPFTYEAEAELVAIAVMGEPQTRRGRKIVQMELVEVLKGKQLLGAFESNDGFAPFGCIMPKNPKRFSDMYREGERVAVYLKKSDGVWSALQMTHLTEQYEPQWKASVLPYFDVLLASETDDPEQRYAQLLASRESLRQLNGAKATSRLTEASYYALNFNPDPRAARLVREMLIASVEVARPNRRAMANTDRERNLTNKQQALAQPAAMQQAVDSQQGTVENVAQPDAKQLANNNRTPHTAENQSDKDTDPRTRNRSDATQAVTFPNTPLDLVTLLAKMHDADSILPVMAHISRLSDDERYPFIQLLPELCRDGDAKALSIVQAELDTYILAYQGDKDHYYYRRLVRLRASIAELLED